MEQKIQNDVDDFPEDTKIEVIPRVCSSDKLLRRFALKYKLKNIQKSTYPQNSQNKLQNPD